MKMRAALLTEPNGQFMIEEVELDHPKKRRGLNQNGGERYLP